MNALMHDPQRAQEEIISEFSLFTDWLDRYQYLIDLGRKLPALEVSEKTGCNLLDGCQSKVWLLIDSSGDAMHIRANSDAAIVSGLIALLIRVYSGATAQQVLEAEPGFIQAIGLNQHLSQTRANGLHAMLKAIRNAARAKLAESGPA